MYIVINSKTEFKKQQAPGPGAQADRAMKLMQCTHFS